MRYLNCTDFKLTNSAVCLGKFDGIHIGHQKLLQCAAAQRGNGLSSVVFTFSVHPGMLFGKGEVDLIYTEAEKIKVMEEEGVDVLVSYPFDAPMFAMEAEQFVKEILMDKMDARVIVVGDDFHFGKDRQGDVTLLKELSQRYGYEVRVFKKVEVDGRPVSSTRIREAIRQGDMEAAAAFMGRPYSFGGKVIHGKQLGRTLGIPTANILLEEHKLLPPNGVYVSRTWVGETPYAGISNAGVKPTVAERAEKLLETYLFDFDGDLYGKEIRVDLLAFERPERKFSSVHELKVRMEKDTAYGRAYFKNQPVESEKAQKPFPLL